MVFKRVLTFVIVLTSAGSVSAQQTGTQSSPPVNTTGDLFSAFRLHSRTVRDRDAKVVGTQPEEGKLFLDFEQPVRLFGNTVIVDAPKQLDAAIDTHKLAKIDVELGVTSENHPVFIQLALDNPPPASESILKSFPFAGFASALRTSDIQMQQCKTRVCTATCTENGKEYCCEWTCVK